MTIGGYNLGGDLDLCTREADRGKFMDQVKKHATTRNVSERTLMLWCLQRSPDLETLGRIKGWIQEEDATGRWLMALPVFELVEE